MKYLKQFGIILLISLMGEALRMLLPLPIPASVYGLVLMLIALMTGIIKIHQIKEVSAFLIEIMPVMFIPAGVGLLEAWPSLRPVWIPVVVISSVTTIIVMVVTGRAAQRNIGKEKKEDGTPLFVFNVTMQNHGGYQDQYGNFTPDISVKDSTNFSLQQYLSLVKLSDSALEHLISYFEEADEKTVIVFFGDHQPSDAVASTVLAKNGMSWNHLTEEQQKLRYQVPYVVWANYDIGEETGADTSVNYLAAEVLERAGVPLDEYRSYLLHLKSEYPVISAVRTVKADGSEVRTSDEKDEMDIYRKLQYYELFDHGTVN